MPTTIATPLGAAEALRTVIESRTLTIPLHPEDFRLTVKPRNRHAAVKHVTVGDRLGDPHRPDDHGLVVRLFVDRFTNAGKSTYTSSASFELDRLRDYVSPTGELVPPSRERTLSAPDVFHVFEAQTVADLVNLANAAERAFHDYDWRASFIEPAGAARR